MQTSNNRRTLIAAIAAAAVFAVGLGVGVGLATGGGGDRAVVREESNENDIAELEEELADMKEEVESDRSFDPEQQPWPYEELDVEEVRKAAHKLHHENSCAYGSFSSIVGTLQEKIGYPYDQIPTYMLHFGRGGVAGSGNVCGALLGSLTAINLIAGEDYNTLASELIEYYKETPFPTDTANEYAEEGAYDTEDYISERFAQSVAGDIACSESKAAWVETSGYDAGSEEREERCARLTGDVAAKATEILNAWAEGTDSERSEDEIDEALADIFPDADFESPEDGIYEARKDGELVGIAGIGEADGHEGPITAAVGVAMDGTVHAATVVEHNETPDLGDVIVEDEFLSQFEGLSVEQIQLEANGGEIDATSGATVSCETATEIVRSQAERCGEYLDRSDI
ncbi:MAG: C-GCAxxG-C-C family (seleno)protein [Spirochaetales bacterium]